MKVVIDTMIWVSVSLSPRGFRSQLIDDLVSRRIRIYSSEYILNELVKTLTVHLGESKAFANDSRFAVARRTTLVALPPRIPRFVPGDPKDDAVVQTAVSAKADYLVTADKEILKLKKVRSVQIVSPNAFAFVLGASPK